MLGITATEVWFEPVRGDPEAEGARRELEAGP